MLVDYILKKLGIRRSTLADIDTMAVGQVFGEEEPLLQFEKVYEMVNHCDLCGGRLLIVIPLVQIKFCVSANLVRKGSIENHDN
jgi:hypothetical protein